VFFSDDIGGLKQVAHSLAQWIKKVDVSSTSHFIRPKEVIAIESVTISAASEARARTEFLSLLSGETAGDLMQRLSSIDVIALFPGGSISVDARFRALKELLMGRSDEVREARYNSRHLFSLTHFTALLESTCELFTKATSQPFDCIQASRSQRRRSRPRWSRLQLPTVCKGPR
jgi:hypothetical protein